jgi:hypothetical protein
MENFNFIEFHQARDFSKKMNVTFEFIRQNFKGLCKSILFIAGPSVLIASMLIGSFMGNFMNLSQASSLNPGNSAAMTEYFMTVGFWLQALLAFVFYLLSTVMSLATINNYIILYGEKRSSKIEVHEVWERVRNTFWMYLGSTILFALMGLVAYIVLLVPIIILADSGGMWLLFFLIPAVICAMLYLLIGSLMTFFIRGYEGLGFFRALGRSLKLVSGKWWSTFGLFMILSMIMGFISYIFLIPFYAITIISTLHQVETSSFNQPSSTMQLITVISFTCYYMAYLLMSALPNIGLAFQYFNLVELKESKGLMEQIETLGQPSSPASSATTPEEEQY